MAIPEGFRALLGRAVRELPQATWVEPGDLVRYGQELMASEEHGDARVLRSTGTIRLHGAGVEDHAIDLDQVGAISMLWQRAVTSFGAALEEVRTSRGKLPDSITRRTRLRLTASPGEGSVVLRIAPRANPLSEVEPDGLRPLIGVPRPLADRASDALLDVFRQVSEPGAESAELVSQRLRVLGPRASSSLQALAAALSEADIALDAAWREPGASTSRASCSVGDSRWLRSFIEGRELDATFDVFSGTVATVSNRERWLVETEEGLEKVVASALENDDVRRVRSGDFVTLRVRTTMRTQPDGTVRTKREALDIIEVLSPD